SSSDARSGDGTGDSPTPGERRRSVSRRCELCGAGSSDERLGDGTGGSPPPGERGRSGPWRGELCSDGASDERGGDAAGELSSDGASDERRGDAAGEATRDSAGRCGEGSTSVGGCDEGASRAAAAGPLLPRPKYANIALRSLCAALCQPVSSPYSETGSEVDGLALREPASTMGARWVPLLFDGHILSYGTGGMALRQAVRMGDMVTLKRYCKEAQEAGDAKLIIEKCPAANTSGHAGLF
ncbi:hypothetical protein T492DRAFT_880722, partial [Pavlovales sp. CCMP2436]